MKIIKLSTKKAIQEDLSEKDVISRKTLKGFFEKLEQGKSLEEALAAEPVNEKNSKKD